MINFIRYNVRQFSNFSAISWRKQVSFQWDDDEVYFVLDPHAELNYHSTKALKQQSADRHVAPLGHIILFPSQPALIFLLNDACLAEKQLLGLYVIWIWIDWYRKYQPAEQHQSYSHSDNMFIILKSNIWRRILVGIELENTVSYIKLVAKIYIIYESTGPPREICKAEPDQNSEV
jgi:hypothetical protein